jgi:autotransporter-associated beta strand protein
MQRAIQIRTLIVMTVLNIGLGLPQVHAANRTWSGAGADANWNTLANWGGTAPSVADNLIFSGTSQQNNTNNISSLTPGWMLLANGGFTLNGTAGNVLSLNGPLTNSAGINILALSVNVTANNVGWNIASGSELRIAGALTNGSAANPLAIMGGGGTLRITSPSFLPNRFFTLTNGTIIVDGGVATTTDGFRLQSGSGFTAVFQVTNNGSLTIGSGGNLRLCQTAIGGSSRVDVSSGILNMAVTAGAGSGDIFVGEAASTTTIFNQTGGLVEFTGNGNNRIAFANASATANGTYNLNGGTLWTKQIVQVTAGSPGGTFNFNGGTLKPTAASTTFFQGVQTANVQSGGAIFDTTNFDITIGQPLPGVGGLTKLGTSTLTLSGTNAYTGGTTVGNGTLAVSTRALAGGGAVTISNAATLKLSVAAVGNAMTNSALNVNATGGQLTFDTGALGNPTTAPLFATIVTANGTATINVTGAALATGTFELIHFASVSGLGNFTLGSVTPGVVATLVTNATSVGLSVSSVSKLIAWSGAANNQWDTSSINWKDLGNANNPTNYAQPGGFGDQVTFDDTLTANPSINVTLTVTPVSFAVSNNTTSYSFTGSGKVSGAVGLAKNGTGSLTVGTTNDYSGGTTLNAGRIRVGVDNALGSGSLTINGGTITSDSTTAHALTNSIKILANIALGDATDTGSITFSNKVDFGGSGRTLTNNSDVIFAGGATNGILASKQGKGTLTIKGNVNYSGASDVQDGTLIYDGATVTDSDRLIADTFTVNGIARLVITNGSTVTVTTTVGNLRSGRQASTGTNYVDLAGLYSLPNADLADGLATLRGDAAYSEMTFWPGGDFAARGVTNTGGTGNTVFKFNGGILRARNDNANFFQGLSQTLVQAGGARIDDGGFAITINQALLDGGGGGLTKSGTGMLALAGANTYTGSTVISNGTMQLTGTGSIANSASIAVNGGATFDVSGLSSTFALGNGQVLSNLTSTGIINGNVNTASGTVGLTYASGTPALAVANGTLTLSASTGFNVNNTGSVLTSGGYKIISTNAAGLVAGTLPSVTVGGSGVATGQHVSLGIVGSELYLIVTNHAPVVASIVTNIVTSGLNWKITITDLSAAAGWSDPDGDAVTFSSVSATSFNGTNVSSDANYIYYNGAATAEDHFTYTVTDGNLTANGTVYLESAAAIAPSISNPTTDGSGHPTFNGSGVPGYTYGVESATSLSGPWINAGTVIAGTDGSWNFIDAGQTNPPIIFYRLYYPYSAGSPPQ